ncbi:endonuclease/exonuclease/phosphatase family protein [Gaoshiqia sp. Z1-71]|uniref:endonuclease/exonuclease/phosphatase family protein n=1 Tax=Gaoshiqia hydrogeniformans TaxID=3290090 RepID=UPI003BF89D79
MKRIILLLAILLVTFEFAFAQKDRTMNVATYNLRLNTPNDGINAWPNRKEEVKSLIRYHEFDLFGTQEGFIGQLNDLLEMEEFAYTGHGREDGKDAGEHSAIFYRKDRFKLLGSGDFWLSETPDVPGLGWDATCCNRICSWAKFRDLTSSAEFFFFSVHFDHEGVEARKESGKLMVRKINEIAGGFPVFCVGDLNSTPDTEQVATMKTLLNDSREVSLMPAYGPEGTFNGFKFDAALDKRIDYIFVSKQIEVLKYGVLTDSKNQRYPSDHQPVVVKARIKKK